MSWHSGRRWRRGLGARTPNERRGSAEPIFMRSWGWCASQRRSSFASVRRRVGLLWQTSGPHQTENSRNPWFPSPASSHMELGLGACRACRICKNWRKGGHHCSYPDIRFYHGMPLCVGDALVVAKRLARFRWLRLAGSSGAKHVAVGSFDLCESCTSAPGCTACAPLATHLINGRMFCDRRIGRSPIAVFSLRASY